MKLQHHLASTSLAIAFLTTTLQAATLPNFKAAAVAVKAPAAPKVPVVHVITPPKMPVIKVPAVPHIPNTPKIPVVKTPMVPKVPVVRVPSAPKIPVVKVPAIPRIVSAPKIPAVKVPVTPKVPVVKVPATPKIPAIARQSRIPQPPKVPQAAPKNPVVIKTPAVPQIRTLNSSKRTSKIPSIQGSTPVIQTVTPAKLLGHFKPVVSVQAARLGQELKASGIVAQKKDFVAQRVGQFSDVNAPRAQVPDSDSDAQEMAVIPPSNSSAGHGTDPATAAGEMGWTPWWAAGSTSSTEYSGSSDPLQRSFQAGAAPREPSSKKLLYAPNPAKPGSTSGATSKKK